MLWVSASLGPSSMFGVKPTNYIFQATLPAEFWILSVGGIRGQEAHTSLLWFFVCWSRFYAQLQQVTVGSYKSGGRGDSSRGKWLLVRTDYRSFCRTVAPRVPVSSSCGHECFCGLGVNTCPPLVAVATSRTYGTLSTIVPTSLLLPVGFNTFRTNSLHQIHCL